MGLLTTRRKYMGRHKPYDAEVEYLELSTGGVCTIDTGIFPTGQDNTFYIGFMMLTGSKSWDCSVMHNNEHYNSSSYNEYAIFSYNDERLIFENGYTPPCYVDVGIPEINKKYEAVMYPDNRVVLNGKEFVGTRDFKIGNPSRYTLKLMRDGRPQGMRQRTYYFKWIKDNKVIMDMIPVRKDGVGYMYDKVSRKLFANANTGNFIIGPDI